MFKERFKFYKHINLRGQSDVIDFSKVEDIEFIVNYSFYNI